MSRSRPIGWITLTLVLAAIATGLGMWQLDRLQARKAANAVELAARELPPLDLSESEAALASIAGRRVVARGRFLEAGEVYLRNRARNQAPGIHLVTPFEISPGGRTVWVIRGFAFAPDGSTPDRVASPDSGLTTISGVGAALPVTADSGQPLRINGRATYRRLDREVALRLVPDAIDGMIYLAGDTAGPGRLPEVPSPTLDRGPHLSYAIQWFGIAIAIFTFGWVILLKPRGDRGSAPPLGAP